MAYISIGRAGWRLAVMLLVRGEHLSMLPATLLLVVLCVWQMQLQHEPLSKTPTRL
ncbi:hypothetical protein [Caballeronia sp. 15715]|uniref:hypothetical protein n=1 Tax=unclassified Caballeronia TaxID=2646786 RepID=UPI0039E49982